MQKKNLQNEIKIGFFGTPDYAVMVLDKLYDACYKISFVVTSPDKPRGRNLVVSPTPAKSWAVKKHIDVFDPVKLNDPALLEKLTKFACDVFIVIAYGKIIPENILNIPKGKSLNIHPSLLPKFQGPSPVESAILADDKDTGVTIIRMDSQMDHGPIVAQKKVAIENWPPTAEKLGKTLVRAGADMVIEILPDWLKEKIEEKEQDHSQATFTKKIEKADGLLDLSADPYKNFLKIQAYQSGPGTYFFTDKNSRIKVTHASFNNGILSIEKVIPEGKREMSYKDFLTSIS